MYQTKVKNILEFSIHRDLLWIQMMVEWSNFIPQALQNKPLTIYGDGRQTRSFQYVSDLVEEVILMMENTDNFISPVNLGNPVEFSILELANYLTSANPRINF